MRKLIKSTLIISMTLMVINVNAQDKKIAFGVKAGVNMSTFSGDADGAKTKFGFVGGVTLDYSIVNNWYLLTGLEFSQKGVKIEETSLANDPKISLSYLQLPIHLGYKLELAPSAKLVIDLGPYFAYGVTGKVKVKEENMELSVDAFGDNMYKRFDLGLGLGVGAEISKISIRIGYDFGLSNIVDSNDAKQKNGVASFTVGYKF